LQFDVEGRDTEGLCLQRRVRQKQGADRQQKCGETPACYAVCIASALA
jgi:hypothetical protein